MANEHVIMLNEENFDDIVLKSEQRVLVDFWAEWCGPCKMVGPIIDDIASEYAGKAVVGKLNVDQSGTIAQRYGVMSIPTMIIFENGQEKERVVGFRPKQDLARLLD